jgi:hypothetical protein
MRFLWPPPSTGIVVSARFSRSGLPRPERPRPLRVLLRDERGIVVLGPLIVITVLVLTLGFLGYLRHRTPPRISLEGRELRHVLAAAEVEYGGVTIERLAAGAAVWVYPLQDGRFAVFRSRKAPNVVGFVPDSLLAPAPRP